MSAAPCRCGLVVEQFAQQRAVGQAGQRVEHRQLVQLRVLGFQLADQILDAPAHVVQVLAELAEFITPRPGQCWCGRARQQRAGLLLEAVDRPQQPQCQHARQHQHADHHLCGHQPDGVAQPLVEDTVDLGVVEGDAQPGHVLAFVQHRDLAADGAMLRRAFALGNVHRRRCGLQVEDFHPAHRGFFHDALHGRAQARFAQRPGRLGDGRSGQGERGRAIGLHDRLAGLA
jgi:uncharacterized protein (DUF1778 family)